MKIFKLIFNSFVLGLFASIIASQNTWLEMRMNVGLFIPYVMAAIFLLYFIICGIKKRLISLDLKLTLLNFCLTYVIIVLVLQPDRTKTIPAAIVRELLGMTSAPFWAVNTLISAVLVIGLAVIGYHDYKHKNRNYIS